MERILALVDGSSYAESVCLHAAWIARHLEAGIEVSHVLGRREGTMRANLAGALTLGARSALAEQLAAADEDRARLAQARGRAILEDAQAILTDQGIAHVQTHLRLGDLLEVARRDEAGLRAIVIGKRGEGADFAAGHLGSNLERIVRSARVPVLVAARAFRPIGHVLMAYDASASARHAVRRLADSPAFRHCRVTLVHAGRDSDPIRAQIEEALLTLASAGLRTRTRLVDGPPEIALAQAVADLEADLLVMGAYGHSRIRALIIGSTTTAMVQSVRIPVLLYR